jgi:hypothetical protein
VVRNVGEVEPFNRVPLGWVENCRNGHAAIVPC